MLAAAVSSAVAPVEVEVRVGTVKAAMAEELETLVVEEVEVGRVNDLEKNDRWLAELI